MCFVCVCVCWLCNCVSFALCHCHFALHFICHGFSICFIWIRNNMPVLCVFIRHLNENAACTTHKDKKTAHNLTEWKKMDKSSQTRPSLVFFPVYVIFLLVLYLDRQCLWAFSTSASHVLMFAYNRLYHVTSICRVDSMPFVSFRFLWCNNYWSEKDNRRNVKKDQCGEHVLHALNRDNKMQFKNKNLIIIFFQNLHAHRKWQQQKCQTKILLSCTQP